VESYDFDVGHAVVLIMIIIGTSHCQHNFINNININLSYYFWAICSDNIMVILRPVISTKMYTS
jgi:hypothetical protein